LEAMWEREPADIFWIEGLEQSLLGYEDMQRLAGWNEQDLMTYSWKDVPPILSHLNLGRERFEAQFDCAVVFVVPLFVVKYLLRRAGDFFDWKSGFFEFSDDRQALAERMIVNGNLHEYLELSGAARLEMILKIKDLLNSQGIKGKQRAALLRETGLLFASGKNYEQAVESFEQAVQIKPDFFAAWNDRGNSMCNLGRYEEAIRSCRKAISLNPNYLDAYDSLGFIYYRQKDYPSEIKTYQQAIKIDSTEAYLYFKRGDSYRLMGYYEEALKDFERAIELDNKYSWAILRRGEVYLRTGYADAALIHLDWAIKVDPKNDWTHYLRALTHLKLNHPEAAETNCQQAISIAQTAYEKDPIDYRNTFNLALYHLAAAHPEESDRLYTSNLTAPIEWLQMAIDDLDNFLHLFPDHAQAQQVKQRLQGAIEATQPIAL
jgi:tetratricopeptide (TPR) repeat protein